MENWQIFTSTQHNRLQSILEWIWYWVTQYYIEGKKNLMHMCIYILLFFWDILTKHLVIKRCFFFLLKSSWYIFSWKTFNFESIYYIILYMGHSTEFGNSVLINETGLDRFLNIIILRKYVDVLHEIWALWKIMEKFNSQKRGDFVMF